MFWNKPNASPAATHEGSSSAPEKDEMVEIINAFRRAAALVAKRQADVQRAETQDAKAVIEKARSWLRSTGAGESACRLFEASRPWYAWAKRDDWGKWNTLAVTDVEGGGDGEMTHSVFRRGGRKWRFEHVRQKHYIPEDDQLRGTLSVSVDDAEVLKIAVAKSFDEYSEWRAVDVFALTAGEWVAELVEMDVARDLAQKRQSAESETARLREQASKLRL